MVIFIFLAMFAIGAGVLYWFAKSRGGIRALFSNKKEVYYVRQTDFGVDEYVLSLLMSILKLRRLKLSFRLFLIMFLVSRLEEADDVELDEHPTPSVSSRSRSQTSDHSDTVDVELQ
jgi:hypothetical protein